METVKTAISIQKLLFEQAEEIAKRMHVSRSRLISMALEEYISKKKNIELLEKINLSCSHEEDHSEKKLRTISKKTHRRLLEDEW